MTSDERQTTTNAKENNFVASVLFVNFNTHTCNEKYPATTLRTMQAVVNAILVTVMDENLAPVAKRLC